MCPKSQPHQPRPGFLWVMGFPHLGHGLPWVGMSSPVRAHRMMPAATRGAHWARSCLCWLPYPRSLVDRCGLRPATLLFVVEDAVPDPFGDLWD